MDPPINWVVTWLWSIVKRLELSEIRHYINLQIIIIIVVIIMCTFCIYGMGLGSIVDVALASEDESCGFDTRLDARFLP